MWAWWPLYRELHGKAPNITLPFVMLSPGSRPEEQALNGEERKEDMVKHILYGKASDYIAGSKQSVPWNFPIFLEGKRKPDVFEHPFWYHNGPSLTSVVCVMEVMPLPAPPRPASKLQMARLLGREVFGTRAVVSLFFLCSKPQWEMTITMISALSRGL